MPELRMLRFVLRLTKLDKIKTYQGDGEGGADWKESTGGKAEVV